MKKRELSDEYITCAIYDALLEYNVNYLPNKEELITKGEFTVSHNGDTRNGKWLTHAMTNRGGFKVWRKALGIMRKDEYQEAVERGRAICPTLAIKKKEWEE